MNRLSSSARLMIVSDPDHTMPETEQRPHKVSFYVKKEKALGVIKALSECFEKHGLDVKIIYSGGMDLDILPQGAGKGQALTYLYKKFTAEGKLPRSTLVCGDTGNDVKLFSIPGVNDVMEVSNAQEELLQWHAENAKDNNKIIHATESCASGIIQAIGHFNLEGNSSPKDLADSFDSKLDNNCIGLEIVKFYLFYERWRCAEIEYSELYLASMKAACHPTGDFVHPSGVEKSLSDCVDAMRNYYGDKQGEDFRVWVDLGLSTQVGSNAWLVKVYKWELSGGKRQCCLTTAILTSQVSSSINDLANYVEAPYKMESEKDSDSPFRCVFYDIEVVHKIAQGFLLGLATACVDNTSGDLFRSPGSIAADIRKEMVDYLTHRSETFIAESIILESDPEKASSHPHDIISSFVDDFASSKMNLFSKVSGWLLSEKREDKIDDFVQEMDMNGFWLIDRREETAHSLLGNVDFKIEFHCNVKCHSSEELIVHAQDCSFRPMACVNEGCTARFSARYMEKHDLSCPFKIIPCEQKCSAEIMRIEMDKHCITTCPMKLVSCSFYAVGCQSTIPYCSIQQHYSNDLYSHLLYVLQSLHKDASLEDLKKRAEQLQKAASSNQLAEARNVRSLTFLVKDLESKMGPLGLYSKTNSDDQEVKP